MGWCGLLELESRRGRLVRSGWGVNTRALGLGTNTRPFGAPVHPGLWLNSVDEGLERLLETMAQGRERGLGQSGRLRRGAAED